MPPFSRLPSDSPLIFTPTWLMYLGACAVYEIACPCAMPDVCAASCGTARLAFPLSLFVLAGAPSSFSTAWSSLRPTSNRYWRFLTNRPHPRSSLFDSVALSWLGYAQRYATNAQSHGPKGDHHVRKPRSRKILTAVYD